MLAVAEDPKIRALQRREATREEPIIIIINSNLIITEESEKEKPSKRRPRGAFVQCKFGVTSLVLVRSMYAPHKSQAY